LTDIDIDRHSQLPLMQQSVKIAPKLHTLLLIGG
jgi:hypothetical protein